MLKIHISSFDHRGRKSLSFRRHTRIYDEALVPVTVRLPQSEVKTLKKIAKKEKLPFSVILRELLKRGLENPPQARSTES
jgi:predicted DNA binding CopG/RHH family protein